MEGIDHTKTRVCRRSKIRYGRGLITNIFSSEYVSRPLWKLPIIRYVANNCIPCSIKGRKSKGERRTQGRVEVCALLVLEKQNLGR